MAAEDGVPPAPSAQEPGLRLGLPDAGAWLALDAETRLARPGTPGGTLVSRLVRFGGDARSEPFARAALLSASRLARSPAEKAAVRLGWAGWEARSPGTPRARIAAALGRARSAATRAEASSVMAALARELPGCAEAAPDLFAPEDRALLYEAVVHGGPALRLLRAAALAPRLPSAAAELAAPLAKAPGFRLEAAAILLAGGRAKAARDALTGPPALAGKDGAERLRIEALLLAAQLRLAGEPAAAPPARRPKRPRPSSRPPAPGAPRPEPSAGAVRELRALLARADALLAQPLAPPERQRLLSEAVRAAAHLGLADEAARFLPSLVALDPATTVGAEELFRGAFLPVLDRTPEAWRAAADRFREQAASYRDVAVRRRATYWAARSLAALGKDASARALYASLLSVAVPDLYARWAGGRLGVPVAAPAAAGDDASSPTRVPLSPDAPSLPSRELLAAGLSSLAEDAAEVEGSAEPLFLAACAADRFEFRRATAILKARWPELGTPEEGALPLAVRRAFYPFREEALIVREAAANGLAPALVYGVIRQESLFQTAARSGAGATGLMQVMPGTGRYLLRQERRRGRPDLKDPEVNVSLGARYLAMLLRQFDGDPIAALAGYNAGPGRPKRWRAQAPGLAEDEFLEAMPIFEPRDYVKRVLFFEAAYAVLHGVPLEPLSPGGR